VSSACPTLTALLLLLGLVVPATAGAQTVQPVRFVDAPSSVDEAAGYVTFTVDLAGPDPDTVLVLFRTTDSTEDAQMGRDFAEVRRTLRWEPGESGTREVVVPIIDDIVDEADERFVVDLSRAQNAFVGDPAFVEVTIVDDDEPSDEPIAQFETYDGRTDDAGRFTLFRPSGAGTSLRVLLDRVPATPDTVYWTSDFLEGTRILVFDGSREEQISPGTTVVPAGQVEVRGSVRLYGRPPDPGMRRAAPNPPFDEVVLSFYDATSSDLAACVVCVMLDMLNAAFGFPGCDPTPRSVTTPGGPLDRTTIHGAEGMLETLTRYRDEVLATTDVGQRYIQLYEELSPALAVALVERPTFVYRVLRAQGNWITAISALVRGFGEFAFVTAPMQADLTALLDEFEDLLDPETAARLAAEREKLQLDSIGGLTMEQFQAQIETLGAVRTEQSSWGGVKARFDE